MDGIYLRINEICEKCGITIRDLEEVMNMKPNSLERLKTEMPSVKDLVLLAKCLDKSPYWIKSGQKLNNLNVDEECLILIYRNLDDRGKRCVTNTAGYQLHEITQEMN